MLPILILGGAAAAALFLSGCESVSQSQSLPPHPHPNLPLGSANPGDRFTQNIKQPSESSRTSPLSSPSVLFTPGGAPSVTALLGKKEPLLQAPTSSSPSPISSIGDFYRRKESQKAVQETDPASSLEDAEFSFALGAQILADPPSVQEPPQQASPQQVAAPPPRKISTTASYQPRFD